MMISRLPRGPWAGTLSSNSLLTLVSICLSHLKTNPASRNAGPASDPKLQGPLGRSHRHHVARTGIPGEEAVSQGVAQPFLDDPAQFSSTKLLAGALANQRLGGLIIHDEANPAFVP